MELTSFVEWRASREKLRSLEAAFAKAEQAPARDIQVRELSLKSLRRNIEQIREEITRFESRIATIGRPRGSNGEGPIPDESIGEVQPVVGRGATPVWSIADLWNRGIAAEDIPRLMPGVELVDVFEALHYYLKYREEIGQLAGATTSAD